MTLECTSGERVHRPNGRPPLPLSRVADQLIAGLHQCHSGPLQTFIIGDGLKSAGCVAPTYPAQGRVLLQVFFQKTRRVTFTPSKESFSVSKARSSWQFSAWQKSNVATSLKMLASEGHLRHGLTR